MQEIFRLIEYVKPPKVWEASEISHEYREAEERWYYKIKLAAPPHRVVFIPVEDIERIETTELPEMPPLP